MKIKFQFLFLGAILLLGFLVRLYRIDYPIADWHSWRQADTASVTRNFVRTGLNVFLPRFDDFSDVSGKGLFNPSGFRMVEFPIYNAVHYIFYSLFPSLGLEVWGRLTSIFASLISAVMLFSIVRRHVSAQAGLLSTAIFLFMPYNIFFSRVILPEPMMVTLFLSSLNLFDLWVNNGKAWQLILAGVLACLAILVKPVAVFFLIPMLWLARKRINIGLLWLGAIIILPTLIWRAWIARFPEGTPAYLWLLNGNGIRFKPAFFRWMFGERLGSMFLGKWGLVPWFFGVIAAVSKPYFLTWLGAALFYIVVFATGNVHHDYYQIPMIPIVSILVALGILELWKKETLFLRTWVKRGLLVVSVGLMFALSWYDIAGNFQINHWDIVYAGRAIQRLTPQGAVVLAPYGGDTAFLYQTDRRGFTHLPLPIKDLIDRFGASYYVSVNYDADTRAVMNKYTVIEQTPGYVVVRLEEPKRPEQI